ncbi:MAG: 2Fe-2S iron-sulfur cluster-binding protein [bacterium]
MPTFKIDGREIIAEPGVSVLDAALRNGIYIPHFCYHPGIPSGHGNCRMCMVEIESQGRRQLTTSCTTQPTDGMIVETDTPKVREVRKAVMEFLLIRHPLDCPVCDQAGECVLQDYSYNYGIPESRYRLNKGTTWAHNIPRKRVGPDILLYNDRCIVCTRCTRFLQQVSGTEELGVFGRGVECIIDNYNGREVDNPLAGNIVDICPVGALVSKDFLFKCRVWYLESTKSVCPICARGCNILIDAYPEEERIMRLRPRANHRVNGFWMCDRGRFGFKGFFGEDRIGTPLRSVDGSYSACSWEEALSEIGGRLRAISDGGGAFAVAMTPFSSNEDAWALGKLASALGSPLLYLLPAARGEEERFAGGFVIEAEKAPNVRGIKEVVEKISLALGDLEALEGDLRAGRIKALYLFLNAPRDYAGLPSSDSLGRVELSVAHDLFSDRVGGAFHYVLPGVSFAEVEGTYTNADGMIQQFWPALPPRGSRTSWDVALELARALGRSVEFSSFDELRSKLSGALSVSIEKDRWGGKVRGRPYHNYY